MLPDAPGRVIPLAAGDRRSRRQFDALVAEARAELAAVEAGDIEGIFGAHRAIGRAVGIQLEYRWPPGSAAPAVSRQALGPSRRPRGGAA